MSHRPDLFSSTCKVLSCTVQEFQDIYDDRSPEFDTETLSSYILSDVIPSHRPQLHAAQQSSQSHSSRPDKHYYLDKLLSGMLEYAPHVLGRRYVAVSLYIASKRTRLLDVAKEWMEKLLLPSLYLHLLCFPSVLHLYKLKSDNEESEDQILFEDSRSELLTKLAIRERNRCAITHGFDRYSAEELTDQRREQEIPASEGPQFEMKATQIIPRQITNLAGEVVAATAPCWEMFRAWTQIDLDKVRRCIDTPRNAILMSIDSDELFRRFYFYLDETAFPNSPNKYMLRAAQNRLVLSNGCTSALVEFPAINESAGSDRDGFDPPDPEFIRIHAAFAKVVNFSGVRDYFGQLEQQAEENCALFAQEGSSDFASLLISER